MISFMRYKYWVGVGASIILGAIFVTAGVSKLLSHDATSGILFKPLSDFLSPVITQAFIIWWLPSIELIIGLLLIIGVVAKLMAVFSLVMIAGFITNNSWMIIYGLGYDPCGCFGKAEIAQAKLSIVGSLYLDVAMLALALIILFCYQRNFFNIYPWFLVRDKIAEKKNRTGSG